MTNVTILPKSRNSMNISRRFIQIAILFFVIIRISLYFYFRSKSVTTSSSTPSLSSTQKEVKHISKNTPLSTTPDDNVILPAVATAHVTVKLLSSTKVIVG